MRLKNISIAVIGLLVVFGGIIISDAMGYWQTESTKTPAVFSDGIYEGLPNPGDIRGSYTFSDIEKAFGIKSELIAEAFGLSTDNSESIQAKNLEEIYGDMSQDIEIGTGSLRLFVSLYTDLPYESEDYIFQSGVDVLIKEDKWNEEKALYMDGHIIDLPSDEVDAKSNLTGDLYQESDIESSEAEHEETVAVRGKTSVRDLLDFGLSIDEIEGVLGLEIQNENMLIRDICSQNNLEFSEVKEIFNNMLEVN